MYEDVTRKESQRSGIWGVRMMIDLSICSHDIQKMPTERPDYQSDYCVQRRPYTRVLPQLLPNISVGTTVDIYIYIYFVPAIR